MGKIQFYDGFITEKEQIRGLLNNQEALFVVKEGLTYDSAIRVSKYVTPKDPWIAYMLDSEEQGHTDVFFVKKNKKNYQHEIGTILEKAKSNYCSGDYGACIKGATCFLQRANNPDERIYAMLGLAYINYSEKYTRLLTSLKKLTEEREKSYEEKTELGNRFLRLYNHLQGRSSSFADKDAISKEIEEWLNSKKEEKKPTSVVNLCIKDFELIRDYINNSQERTTIEDAGERLGFTWNQIDCVKLMYAQCAIRAKFPEKASEYIKAVVNAPGSKAAIQGNIEMVNKEQRLAANGRALPPINGFKKGYDYCEIKYVPSGKRKIKK